MTIPTSRRSPGDFRFQQHSHLRASPTAGAGYQGHLAPLRLGSQLCLSPSLLTKLWACSAFAPASLVPGIRLWGKCGGPSFRPVLICPANIDGAPTVGLAQLWDPLQEDEKRVSVAAPILHYTDAAHFYVPIIAFTELVHVL